MPRVDGRRERISPPPELPDRERSLWVQTVGDCRPEHFVPSDAPLLATYCAALAEREAADRHLDEEGRVLAGAHGSGCGARASRRSECSPCGYVFARSRGSRRHERRSSR